jgi:hypothetical protein
VKGGAEEGYLAFAVGGEGQWLTGNQKRISGGARLLGFGAVAVQHFCGGEAARRTGKPEEKRRSARAEWRRSGATAVGMRKLAGGVLGQGSKERRRVMRKKRKDETADGIEEKDSDPLFTG